MLKLSIACAATLMATACAHKPYEPPADLAQRDWSLGFDESRVANSPPVGPLDGDAAGYQIVKLREAQNQLSSPIALQELDQIMPTASQVLSSALALPLFQAGVYRGSPELIDRACASARKVSHAALRATGDLDKVAASCVALTTTRPGSDGCGEGAARLRDAYALLASGKPSDANKLAAEGVRVLRDRCTRVSSPRRTPVDPSSRGFLIVWALHAAEAPPVTFLAGEPAPRTAEAVNDAFLRGVRALRGPLSASR